MSAGRQDGDGELDAGRLRRKDVSIRRSVGEAETVEHYRKYFGPTLRTFEALDSKGRDAFRGDLEALFSEHNRATDGTLLVESEFLEVVATRA
ncbi:MAG TPA: hypothetical protein VER38_02160 [Candidatus Eisenbacteria bacterium]|nr:hypothetical protein [Candidatus Eisenbacteria bacterium]